MSDIMYDLEFDDDELPANVIAEPKPLKGGGDIKIWRYIDLGKFISFLQTGQLFLTNSRFFDDPFEGSLPRKFRGSKKFLKEKYNLPDATEEAMHSKLQTCRKHTFISSWHMNRYESAAMWGIYTKSNESIAIQSTYRKLVEAVGEQAVIGGVGYIDYEKDPIPMDDLAIPFLFKRKSYMYEQELRVIHIDHREVDKNESGEPPKTGHPIDIDTNSLIERIYLSPKSHDYLLDLLNELVPDYGVQAELKRSDLDQDPLY